MSSELALQKLNELREVAPEETQELLDGLATVLILRQELQNPMYGAKVTFHDNPEGDYVECDREEYEQLKDEGWPTMSHASGEDMLEADEEELVFMKFVVSEDEENDVTEYGTVKHRAIVFEPGVSNAPDGIYWDPNQKEYVTPDDYPMGTVNLIRGENGPLGEEYNYEVVTETSVTPAEGTPTSYSYTPGW